jgi:hypothetical protein
MATNKILKYSTTRKSKTLIYFIYQNPKATNEKANVKIVLKKIGKSMKEDQFTEKSSVVGVQKIAIGDAETAHDGMAGSVFIPTSQPISNNNLKESITIDPVVNFSVTNNDKGISIVSEDFNPDQSYEITITEGVVGIFGGKLKNDFTEDVSFR